MSTDVAEVVGAALGLNLLFGIPLFPAALIAGAGAFTILALQQAGFRRLEAAISALVGWLAYGETLSPIDWIGAAAIAAALVLVRLPQRGLRAVAVQPR